MNVDYKGSGTVFYRGMEYKCNLYLNEEEGGNLCRITVGQAFSSALALPLEFEYLSGELDNGYRFTLYRATRTAHNSYPQENIDTFDYQAKYLFSGIRMDEHKPVFESVSYTLSDMIRWGGITPLEIDDHYRLGIHDSGATNEILYSDEEWCISYHVYVCKGMISRYDLLEEQIIFKQKGAISITANNQEYDISYFDQRFEQIRQLIEYVTLTRVNIEEVCARSSNYIRYVDKDHSYQQDIAIYGPGIGKPAEKEGTRHKTRCYLVSMRDLIQHDSFKYYIGIHSKLQPVIDLYLEPLEGYQSARRTFLNVVQALETYHSRFIAAGLVDYKARVAALVEATLGNKELLEAYLLRNKGKLALRDRIADLLYANGQIYFETGDIARNEFPNVIADTRNYYIHYDEKRRQILEIIRDDQLSIYCRVLLKILDYYVLKELGFNVSNKEFKERMDIRWGDISIELVLLKKSEKIER